MREGDVLEILSTYTPPSLRGREIAARLTEAAIAFARAEGLRVRPTCSYTRTFFHQHPELGQMLEDCA
jgi:predicted GNAT family acetyltransferase